MSFLLVLVGILCAIVLAFVGVIFLIIIWPALFLSVLGYKLFGDRGARWFGGLSLLGSGALMVATEGRGPGPLWSVVYFVAPPVLAANWGRPIHRVKAEVGGAVRHVSADCRSAIMRIARILRGLRPFHRVSVRFTTKRTAKRTARQVELYVARHSRSRTVTRRG